MINGKEVNYFPEKATYSRVDVTCDNEADGTWDTDKWGIIVTNLKQSPTVCKVDFIIESGTIWNYEYISNEQKFITPVAGNYQIELWGAQGGYSVGNGSIQINGGLGSYTKGKISLKQGQQLYVYVGGAGENAVAKKDSKGGYNGGGLGTWDHGDDEAAGGGGGATDVRLKNGDWNDFESLKSRIMIAAGGGGASNTYSVGPGGGIEANKLWSGLGVINQTNGYAFGRGQDATGVAASDGVGGGGSGYYGGRTQDVSAQSSGTGGSSFISGHEGCNAIKDSSTANNIQHSGQSIHYSGLYFTETKMVDGAGYSWTTKKETQTKMPTHDGTGTMVGNSGNGYAKITYLE